MELQYLQSYKHKTLQRCPCMMDDAVQYWCHLSRAEGVYCHILITEFPEKLDLGLFSLVSMIFLEKKVILCRRYLSSDQSRELGDRSLDEKITIWSLLSWFVIQNIHTLYCYCTVHNVICRGSLHRFLWWKPQCHQ